MKSNNIIFSAGILFCLAFSNLPQAAAQNQNCDAVHPSLKRECWANNAKAGSKNNSYTLLQYEWLNGRDYTDAKFVKADMQGVWLNGSNISGADFSGAILKFAYLNNTTMNAATKLGGVDCSKVQFDGANCRGVDFRSTTVWQASFKGVDLTGANFSGNPIFEVNFNESNLCGADFTNTKIDPRWIRAAKIDCQTKGIDRKWWTDNGGVWVETPACWEVKYKAGEKNLSKADFTGINMKGWDLSGRKLEEANLSGQDLTSCNLSGISFWRANLAKANLSNLNLSGCLISYAYAEGANFTNTNLNGANLQNTNLQSVSFRNADLRGADLNGTLLFGADVTDAQLQGTRINWETRGINSGDWTTKGASYSPPPPQNYDDPRMAGKGDPRREGRPGDPRFPEREKYVEPPYAEPAPADENTKRDWLNKLNAGQKDLANALLDRSDLSGKDLSQRYFNFANLSAATTKMHSHCPTCRMVVCWPIARRPGAAFAIWRRRWV